MIDNFAKLESDLNYKFTDLSLLKEALSHPSLKQIDNQSPNYERLEFLGDSILGFLVTELIFHKFDSYAEGEIAKIKAHVVSSEVIVEVASKLNLADYMIMTPGEERSGGRENRHNIENTMEALLASIYLDSDISTTSEIVNTLWSKQIENVDFSIEDPKTYLQELLQSKMQIIPVYKVVKQEGAVHAPVFTVQISANDQSHIGTGRSIKEAEKNAARAMIKHLKE